MQVLEMAGKFSDSKHVKIGATRFCYDSCTIAPRFYVQKDNLVAVGYFGKNEQRDEYFNSVVKWISEEQFKSGKLEIGDRCKFSNDGKKWTYGKYAGMCAEQLGEPRFLYANSEHLIRFKYAYPSVGADFQIDGDVYTWEIMGDQ